MALAFGKGSSETGVNGGQGRRFPSAGVPPSRVRGQPKDESWNQRQAPENCSPKSQHPHHGLRGMTLWRPQLGVGWRQRSRQVHRRLSGILHRLHGVGETWPTVAGGQTGSLGGRLLCGARGRGQILKGRQERSKGRGERWPGVAVVVALGSSGCSSPYRCAVPSPSDRLQWPA